MAPAARPSPKADNSRSGVLVRVGTITGTHGLKGALRVRPDDPDSAALGSVARIYLEAGGLTREHKLLATTGLGRGRIRIVLEGTDTLEAAQALSGSVVSVAASDLPPLKAGEFYYFAVLGMEVRLADGRALGRIEDVFFNGANDVWTVRGGEAEALIPVIEDVVKTIDFEARRVTIEAIPGLLD